MEVAQLLIVYTDLTETYWGWLSLNFKNYKCGNA